LSASTQQDRSRKPSFQHRDILGWTRSNRTEIEEDIHTLLVERPIVGPATTLGGRFPEWWCAVGHPIELAFGEEIFEGRLDFGRMMAANRQRRRGGAEHGHDLRCAR
jgi:hypothetical protein